MGDKLPEKRVSENRAGTFVTSSPKGKLPTRNKKPATPAKKPSLDEMEGECGKKDLKSDARSFCDSLSNVFLLKKRDPQTKHLLEKSQYLINGLLAEPVRPTPATPAPRTARPGAGMGQLWVKLDELKRENDDLKRLRGRPSDERAGSPKSPKSPKPQPEQAETPLSEYNRLKQDTEILSQQVEKLQKGIKEHQIIASSLQDECKRYKSALEVAQKLAMKAREDLKKSESNLASLKAESDTLKHKLASQPTVPPATPAKPNISSPKPKVRADNRHSENIGERCRPSSIAVSYTTLESQQWMDAKESLEEGESEEEEIIKFLCDIVMNSHKSSLTVLQSVENIIAQMIACPTLSVQLAASIPSTACKLPDELSDLLCQRLRISYDKIDTTTLSKITRDTYSKNSKLLSQWSEEHVQHFIKECGAITWQMVIQKPQMKLSDKFSSYDVIKHRLWWSCNQSKARKVDYTIWPALYDYEGGNLMIKACVHAS